MNIIRRWLNRRASRRHQKWLRKSRIVLPAPWHGAIVKNWKEPS